MGDKIGGVMDRFNGASAAKDKIDAALRPDPDGLRRVDSAELTTILGAYNDARGRWLDGRSSIESYARARKPALAAALSAERNGSGDPWTAYVTEQVRLDRTSSASDAAPAPTDAASEAWWVSPLRIIKDMLVRRDTIASEVNATGDLVEAALRGLASEHDLSDVDFERLKAAAADPTVMTLSFKRLSSVDMAALRYLTAHPSTSKAEFVAYARDNLAM